MKFESQEMKADEPGNSICRPTEQGSWGRTVKLLLLCPVQTVAPIMDAPLVSSANQLAYVISCPSPLSRSRPALQGCVQDLPREMIGRRIGWGQGQRRLHSLPWLIPVVHEAGCQCKLHQAIAATLSGNVL